MSCLPDPDGFTLGPDEYLTQIERIKSAVNLPVIASLNGTHCSGWVRYATMIEHAGADAMELNPYEMTSTLSESTASIEQHICELVEAVHAYPLSSHDELAMRLRWLGIVSPEATADLACSGGVYTSDDALRAIMCGAHAVQMVSALLRYGPTHLQRVISGVREWMIEYEYESIQQMRASMNIANCPDPRIYTRWGYINTLRSWA